ncbi:hypothetical protein BG004_003655 [Podila humilis]|nr:hypothetical protein BG004_003655 [Podila humilis]
MATAATVFEIHFLQEIICRQLTTDEIQRCTLVCKAWRACFAPFLWSSVIIRTRGTANKFTSPKLLYKLSQNARYIRSLDSIYTREIWPVFLAQPIVNLTTFKCPVIKFRRTTRWDDNYRNNGIIAILSLCRNLHTLELGFMNSSNDTILQLLEAIRNHSCLRNLKIEHPCPAQMSPVSWIMYANLLWSCARLDILSINTYRGLWTRRDEHIGTKHEQLLQEFQIATPKVKIRRLDFEGATWCTHREIFVFLRQCWQLEYLALPYIGSHYSFVSELAETIKSTMSNLRHIDFFESGMNGDNLTNVLYACTGLISVAGLGAYMGSELLINALLEHRETLQVVTFGFYGATFAMGGIMHELLCACPNLIEMSAMGKKPLRRKRIHDWYPILDMKFVKEGSAWSCVGLKSLAMEYQEELLVNDDLGTEERDIVPSFLIRELSKMSQLEELRLGRVEVAYRPTTQDDTSSRIAVRRRTATRTLATLSTLRELKRLELRNMAEFIDKDDLKVAKEQWKGHEWVLCS